MHSLGTYLFYRTTVSRIPLPESSIEPPYVPHSTSFVFKTWMPAQRSISEHPQKILIVVPSFHFIQELKSAEKFLTKRSFFLQ